MAGHLSNICVHLSVSAYTCPMSIPVDKKVNVIRLYYHFGMALGWVPVRDLFASSTLFCRVYIHTVWVLAQWARYCRCRLCYAMHAEGLPDCSVHS